MDGRYVGVVPVVQFNTTTTTGIRSISAEILDEPRLSKTFCWLVYFTKLDKQCKCSIYKLIISDNCVCSR